MAWPRNDESDKERARRRETVQPGCMMAMVTISLPANMKVWLWDRAEARKIPVSWIACEVIKRGIEAIELEEG